MAQEELVQDEERTRDDYEGRTQWAQSTVRRSWWKRLLWAAPVLLSLFFLAGFFLARTLFVPPAYPTLTSSDVIFTQSMIVHHNQAVDMAFIIRDRSSDPTLRIIALDIIRTQENQRGQMMGWLTIWKQPLVNPGVVDMTRMKGMATAEQVSSLETLPIKEAEIRFLQLMIAHHEGGITMAQDVLKQTTRAEVKRMANAIVVSQQSEVTEMQKLLQKRGA